MKKEKRFQNIPRKWFILLPLLGIVHTLLGRFGGLEQGSWLNFLLFLGVVFLWIYVVLKETAVPFSPLVWIGTIYGGIVAVIDFLFWFFFREALGLEENVWSFDDLLYAITYYLRPGFKFIGNILLGVVLGVLVGFTAHMILKFQQKR